MSDETVLIVDDDAASLRSMEKTLTKTGLNVITADSGEKALEILKKEFIDLVLTDIKMHRVSGMDVLHFARSLDPPVPVMLLTGFGSIENAVDAIKTGAEDYMTKPADIFELRRRVEKILNEKRLQNEVLSLKRELNKKYGFSNLIGNSEEMEQVYDKIVQLASARSTVLIQGESGTGKELIARAIHYNSPRKANPFIPLNCSALSEGVIESELFGHEKGAFTGADRRTIGKFEQAHKGTLFLDEVGEIALNTQIKLLRFLEERELTRIGGAEVIKVDVRLIAATNADLEELVQKKRFREDLYYRLKVVTVNVPPLRRRTDDVPLLTDFFLEKFNRENNKNIKGFTSEAMDALLHYKWPGNVRELKNLIESLVVISRKNTIEFEDLPSFIKDYVCEKPDAESLDSAETMEEAERLMIERALKKTRGNRTKAAEMLGIGIRTLQRKLKKYNL